MPREGLCRAGGGSRRHAGRSCGERAVIGRRVEDGREVRAAVCGRDLGGDAARDGLRDREISGKRSDQRSRSEVREAHRESIRHRYADRHRGAAGRTDRDPGHRKDAGGAHTKGVEYKVRPIKEKNPTAAELAKWIKKSGREARKFFNTSGQLYREMELSAKLKDMSEQEMIDLLATDGMLVKRPLLITDRDGFINLNVKVEPDKAFFWRDIYESVVPGYHQNKEHWNTVILDGSIPDKDIECMIAESYDLISDNPTKRIYEAVKRIPKGKVATYGQIAELAGDKRMARAVGNALHKNPDPDNIPCFRVVNAKGELAGEFAFGGAGEQAKLLEADGIEVTDGRVDLERYQWKLLDTMS